MSLPDKVAFAADLLRRMSRVATRNADATNVANFELAADFLTDALGGPDVADHLRSTPLDRDSDPRPPPAEARRPTPWERPWSPTTASDHRGHDDTGLSDLSADPHPGRVLSITDQLTCALQRESDFVDAIRAAALQLSAILESPSRAVHDVQVVIEGLVTALGTHGVALSDSPTGFGEAGDPARETGPTVGSPPHGPSAGPGPRPRAFSAPDDAGTED